MDHAVRQNRSRDTALDKIKGVAILGVLLIHISAVGFSGYPVGSASWMISVAWGTVLRAAVPLFFMVSGTLFLRPEKPLQTRQIYSKYLLRILIALFVWAALYEGFDLALRWWRGESLGMAALKTALTNIVLFKHHFHLYYLHIILIVYMFLPVTRVFTAHASKRQMQYALALWAVFGIIYPFARQFPPFQMLGGIPAQYAINMTYGAIGYGVLGYYLRTYRVPRKAAWVYGVGALIAFFGTVFSSIHTGKAAGAYLEGMSPGVFLMAVGIFVFVSAGTCSEKGARFWGSLSRASFCIYLVHDFFNILFRGFGFDALAFSPVFSIPLAAAANLILSLLVYWVLSKIPVVKKYLV